MDEQWRSAGGRRRPCSRRGPSEQPSTAASLLNGPNTTPKPIQHTYNPKEPKSSSQSAEQTKSLAGVLASGWAYDARRSTSGRAYGARWRWPVAELWPGAAPRQPAGAWSLGRVPRMAHLRSARAAAQTRGSGRPRRRRRGSEAMRAAGRRGHRRPSAPKSALLAPPRPAVRQKCIVIGPLYIFS